MVVNFIPSTLLSGNNKPCAKTTASSFPNYSAYSAQTLLQTDNPSRLGSQKPSNTTKAVTGRTVGSRMSHDVANVYGIRLL